MEAFIGIISGFGITVIMILLVKLSVYLTVDKPAKKEEILNEFRSSLKQLQDDVNAIKTQTNQTDDRINSICTIEISELKLKLDEIYKQNRRIWMNPHNGDKRSEKYVFNQTQSDRHIAETNK